MTRQSFLQRVGTNIHYWLKLMAVVVLLMLAVFGVQAVDHYRMQDEVAAANNRIHFYRVIAGQDSASAPTVDNRLAKDLRDMDIEEVKAFRGTSNSYGGITDALGVDPFDNTGLDCDECGPLNLRVEGDVIDAKQGKIDLVVKRNTVTTDQSYEVTPFGIGMIPWIIFLCLLALIIPAWQHWKAKRFWNGVESLYPEEYRLIHEVDEYCQKVPFEYQGQITELLSTRDKMEREIIRLNTPGWEGGDRQRIADLKDSLEARISARKELESWK